MREIVIASDVDGEDPIVLTVDDSQDYVFKGADLDKLDADLKAIDEGKVEFEHDPTEPDGPWETEKGREIGMLCAVIDDLSPAEQERILTDDAFLNQVIADAMALNTEFYGGQN